MAIKIGSNFTFQGKQPNFERDRFATKAAMKAFPETSIDDGHLSYCAEDENTYQFKSSNSVDAVTGKWRVFKADVDLSAYATKAALDGYQPKHNVDYVATKDFNDSELPIDVNSVDLNGFTLNITKDTTLTKSFIINGTIAVADTCISTLAVDNCSNVIIKNIGTKEASIVIDKGNFDNCDFGCFAKINEGNKTSIIRNSTFRKDLNVLANCSILVYNTKFNGKIVINDTKTIINAFGCILSEIPIIENASMEIGSSHFFYCGCKDTIYLIGSFDLIGDFYDSGVDSSANEDSYLPISSSAVYAELASKVEEHELYNYVTFSYLEKNYQTGSYNSETYVKRKYIYNIHVFCSSIANYSDLPGMRNIGDVYKINNANIEHGIKAGDYVVWDGTTWYNMGSKFDESLYVTTNEMNKALGNKVDIVTGKGLSTNDYTTEEKNKLSKAFTKDTASTAPGQVVAGPATTQGNLYLRKLIADDIPDLKSKYQKLDSNGYQEKAKAAGLIVKHGNTGDTGSGYLIAEIDQAVGGQMGPDWYYATDGTLQDITTKIPKITLDDAVSTTSTNGVENQAITKYVDGKVTTINNNITDLHSSLESTQTDFVDLRNKVNAMPKTVFITQAAYNASTTKDANTIYYING